MLTINFLPESDREDYSKPVQQFETIWQEYGPAIITSWEKHSHLEFKVTIINAIVSTFDKSYSHPLHLRSTTPDQFKKLVLTHEIGHRILSGLLGRKSNSLEAHQILYLLLWDVIEEVFGNDALEELEEWEIRSGKPEEYNKAWEWAAQFDTYEKRQAKFKELYETKPDVIV